MGSFDQIQTSTLEMSTLDSINSMEQAFNVDTDTMDIHL